MPEFDFQRKQAEAQASAGQTSHAPIPDEYVTATIPMSSASSPTSTPASPPSFSPASGVSSASQPYAHAGQENRNAPQWNELVGETRAMPVAQQFAQPQQVQQPYGIPSAPRRKKGNPVTRWITGPAKHGFLSFWLWMLTLPCVGIMALRSLPESDQDGRALPEIIAFVPIFGILSAVILVLAVLWRRWLLTAVSLVCVVIQISWHIGFFVPSASISDSARQTVQTAASVDDNVARIMTLNTKEGQASAASIVATVREQHVEVLALQEVHQSLLDELQAAGIYEVLPYMVTSIATDSDNGGMNVLFTMAPMGNISQSLLPIETSQMPACTIIIGSTQVRFVSAHPNSPTRGQQGLWSEGLGTIGSLKDYDWTYVIMGDFNSTWDHPRFRSLLGDRFVDAGEQAGEGFHFTYPSNSKIPSVIEIDHIIHDKGVTVADLDTVEIAGTDHKALLGTLETDN